MSTSPIGTRVPTLAPNSIIRAGIPLQDNFNATDVAVSLEAIAVAGEWLPEVSVPSQGGTMDEIIPFRYIKVGSMVFFSGWIYFTLETASTSDNFTLSLGDSIQPSNNFTSPTDVVCTISRIAGIITAECSLQASDGSKNLSVSLNDVNEGASLKLTFSGSYNINN
jgi:hypothetical protein